jgi:molybdate transport system ATP-binding protein
MVLSGFFDSIGLYTTLSLTKKYSQWLELVHLNHLKSPFKTLSVGQQRLALIIRAVINTPLLILDEAVEGLDDENAVISQLITLLSQQTNIAILYVSQD